MLFIGQNLKDVQMTFFSWTFDLLLINSRYLVFEVSEGIVQRSSRPEVFCTEGVLKNFAKFTGKHLSQSLFFNKVPDLRPATLFKDRLRHRCFPKFYKFFENTFFYRTPAVAASEVYFSSHQVNIVCKYKLNRKPTMKQMK